MRRADPVAREARELARAWHDALRVWRTVPLAVPRGRPARAQVRPAACVVCLLEPAAQVHALLLAHPPTVKTARALGVTLAQLRRHRRECMDAPAEPGAALGVVLPLGVVPEGQVAQALAAQERQDEQVARMVRRLRAKTATATIIRTQPHRWASPPAQSRAYGLLALRVGAALGCAQAAGALAVLAPEPAPPAPTCATCSGTL